MKRTILCNIALALAFALAPVSPAAETQPTVEEELTADAIRMGFPKPPADMTPEFRTTLALILDLATVVESGGKCSEYEAVKHAYRGMSAGLMDMEQMEKELPPGVAGADKWYALRDLLFEKAKDNPGAHLALFAHIRRGWDEVPADMRTDEFMRGLVAKSAEAGDLPAMNAAAYNHIWGFYGTPVDEKTATSYLQKLSRALLRGKPDPYQSLMENAADLCRNDKGRITLRLAALSLARAVYRKESKATTSDFDYTFAQALMALTENDLPFGGIAAAYAMGSVLATPLAETPEWVQITLRCVEKTESVEGEAVLRERAREIGVDMDKDYHVPAKPEYRFHVVADLANTHLEGEEKEYICKAATALKEKVGSGASDPDTKANMDTLIDFLQDLSDEERFDKLIDFQQYQPDAGKRAYNCYLLYNKGLKDSGYGKDKKKAAEQLALACSLQCKEALLERIYLQLEIDSEPTEEMIQTLLDIGLADSIYLVYRIASAYPDKFFPGCGLDTATRMGALTHSSVDAWREMAQRYTEPEDEEEEEAQLITRALTCASEDVCAEDFLALDKALEANAAKHPENAGIVELIRLAALNLGLQCDSIQEDKPCPYIPVFYKGAKDVDTTTELAERLEALVKGKTSPEDFAELQRRLKVDINRAIKKAEK